MTEEESPEVKALNYAMSLGLNSVYDEALEKRKALGDKTIELSDVRGRRRQLEAFKTDVEMSIIEDERLKHTDMSVAAMEKHLKIAFNNNGDLRETRDELMMVAGQIEVLEHEVSLLETDIKIAVSRLHELGGFYQFMAVIKQAEATRKTIENKGPW